jgi:hypothetical protein
MALCISGGSNHHNGRRALCVLGAQRYSHQRLTTAGLSRRSLMGAFELKKEYLFEIWSVVVGDLREFRSRAA